MQTDKDTDLGRFRLNVCPVRHLSSIDMVGILMGYYGTCHLFCNLRHCHACLCIFRPYKTSKYFALLEFKLQISFVFCIVSTFKICQITCKTNWFIFCFRSTYYQTLGIENTWLHFIRMPKSWVLMLTSTTYWKTKSTRLKRICTAFEILWPSIFH